MKTYTVTVCRTCYERGVYQIEAESEEEATEIAEDKLYSGDDADWNPFDGDCAVVSCEMVEEEAGA